MWRRNKLISSKNSQNATRCLNKLWLLLMIFKTFVCHQQKSSIRVFWEWMKEKFDKQNNVIFESLIASSMLYIFDTFIFMTWSTKNSIMYVYKKMLYSNQMKSQSINQLQKLPKKLTLLWQTSLSFYRQQTRLSICDLWEKNVIY